MLGRPECHIYERDAADTGDFGTISDGWSDKNHRHLFGNITLGNDNNGSESGKYRLKCRFYRKDGHQCLYGPTNPLADTEMDRDRTRAILEDLAGGRLSVDDAMLQLRLEPFEDLGFAKVDLHRGIRQGIPEVIYGAGKSPEQIVSIARVMLDRGVETVMVTRLDREKADSVSEDIPIDYDPMSRIGVIGERPSGEPVGKVTVITAGTSDIPVAEEAAVTAELLGNRVVRVYDAGVAGIHRLLSHSEDIMTSRAIIAVAGMEGALASVVGGMADCPVIAVPTSVGYGASFGGLSALLTMLNSCASGVGVVNIDNGFGAGYLASMINHMESP